MKNSIMLMAVFTTLITTSSWIYAQSNSSAYNYTGSCVQKIKLERSSSLTPELKAGEQMCVEYSPKVYQGAGSTGATVVLVSATWCAPCKAFQKEYKKLLEVAEKHKATVKIILDRRATDEQISSYPAPAEFFISKDLRAFEEGVLGAGNRVPGFPTVYVINSKGKVVKELSASVSDIEDVLEKL